MGVLVGPKGTVKKTIEKNLDVVLDIESDSGIVKIILPINSKDPSTLFRSKEVIIAIARGFSPEHAFRLIFDDATLDIIELRMIFGKSESAIKRIKGRIIGMGGKTRKIIEEITETNISIYGHTIGIIGNLEEVQFAREAIQMLINGNQHRAVYGYLHKKRLAIKKKNLELWEKPFNPERKVS